jgi:hypothetical protein
MDLEKLLADAEKIPDPVEREKELNRITTLLLQKQPSPARQAVTGFLADPRVEAERIGKGPESKAPTRKDAENFNRLIAEQKLAAKISPNQRMEAYSDDELLALADGFSSEVPEAAAQEELAKRKELDEGSYLTSWDGINRLAGQVVGSAAELITSDPIALVGLAGKGYEKILGDMPLVRKADGTTVLEADDIIKAAGEISENIRSAVGISQPRNIRETVASLVPSVMPIAPGKMLPDGPIWSLVEAVTPLVVGTGNKRILANFATAFVADQALRELGDDEYTPYKTAFDQLFPTEAPDKAYPWAYDAVMTGLGMMAGASIVSPIVAQAMRNRRPNKPPKLVELRDLDPHAPKNLKTLETAGDLYKTYLVDEKSALSGLAERAGVPGIDQLNRLIDQDTQIAGIMRVNEAMRTGKLSTVGGNFNSPVSPMMLHKEYLSIPEPVRKNIDMYLKYKDLSDDLHIRIANNIGVREARQKLAQVNQAISQLEASTPQAKSFHKKYQAVTGAVRHYLSQGPNAMISQRDLARLGRERANWVPIDVTGVDPRGNLLERIVDGSMDYSQRALDSWYTQRRDLRNVMDIDLRADSMDVLMDYTRNALKSKMEHDVRGAYVRALKNSPYGRQTIRKKTKKDRGLNPSRMIEVYENGEKKVYLSSKLQAELLKFDPYVAKFPNMYSVKRGFEQMTTGFASVFAPMTAIRDTIAGNTLVPPNVKGPGGPLSVASAVFKQNWANTQRAAIEILESGMDLPFLDNAARKTLSQQISSSYMNSAFHLANSVGGFDASIMKSNIENAKGIMRQLKTTLAPIGDIPGARPTGRFLATLGKGWINLFDSIQEAPRFAAFERNVKAGMDPTDAVREAKKLTGDTMRSGRVYNPKGNMIEVDAVNKASRIGSRYVGGAAEWVRESTPYLNPMIQSMRRLGDRIIDDPINTNLKAWTYVGLPAMVAMGWNDMLGDEYNKFAFQERTSRDIAMNLYIGVPGLPPEKGIQIPLPHELMFYNSPWTTAIYAMNQGSDGDEVKSIMKHMAGTILENSLNVGFPQLPAAAMSFMGMKSPQSINPLTWKDDVYEMREDNLGVFPQNVEETFRNLWGSTGQLAMASAAAAYEGGPEAFFDELGIGIINRLPIVKGPFGTTVPVTNFTPLSQIKQAKVDALDEFTDLYQTHFARPNMMQERANPKDAANVLEDPDADEFTRMRMAPIRMPKPDNPIYEMFGEQINATINSNEEGYTTLGQRSGLLSRQIKLLRSYTAGRRDAYEEYKKEYVGADERFQKAAKRLEEAKPTLTKEQYLLNKKKLANIEEAAKIDRLVKELDLDLTKRDDTMVLVAHLERLKGELMQKQISIIQDLEEKITGTLRAQQLIPPNKSFKVEKHLGPKIPTDLFQQQ